jgi:hypothetical protein
MSWGEEIFFTTSAMVVTLKVKLNFKTVEFHKNFRGTNHKTLLMGEFNFKRKKQHNVFLQHFISVC